MGLHGGKRLTPDASGQPGGTVTLAGRQRARIGYGAMQLAENRGLTREASIQLLRRVRELGVDHIDTAQFYGEGTANELIRSALAPYTDELAIATKVGAARVGGSLVAAQQPAQLREQVEQNLSALGTERLDIVNLRRMDGGAGIVAEGDQVVALDDQLAELVQLRDQGKIDAIGLSNVSLEQLHDALPAGPVCVQNNYNVLDRAAESLLVDAVSAGLAWVPFFPLGSAFPGRRRVTDDEVVRAVAEQTGATPAQVGLAWLLAHEPRIVLIPGTTSVQHLQENIDAGTVRLDDTQLAALDALGGA